MDNAGSQVSFTVYVSRGGRGVGELRLTVKGPPVDLFALLVETVASGRIMLH